MPKKKMQKSKVREYAELIIMSVVIALFIRTFVVAPFKIPSESMKPTLLVGDHILVNRFIYGFRIPYLGKRVFPFTLPQRGDVIVFIPPHDRNKDYIKRVIGLPGDKVEVKGREIYINDHLLADPWGVYVPEDFIGAKNYGPEMVPPHSLFVMGDNRNNSQDSRYWGFASFDDVLGKAFIRHWSWDWQSPSLVSKVRWRRIGSLIR
jgi:signal peptidase I